MALAFQLQGGHTPAELSTEGALTLEPEGRVFAAVARSLNCVAACLTAISEVMSGL
jgi:hypothetical protein